MKFEYELHYDFVSTELSFAITKMPEDLRYEESRDVSLITEITSSEDNEWAIRSYSYPEINPSANSIYLRGMNRHRDDECQTLIVDKCTAVEIAEVLAKFQQWVKGNYHETIMTIAEIEEKLGIKNLKIIEEVKKDVR